MALTVSVTVTVPLTVVDVNNNSTVLPVSVAPGRTAGEVKVTFTQAQLTQIGTDNGVVYLTGSDLTSAASLLDQAVQMAAGA